MTTRKNALAVTAGASVLLALPFLLSGCTDDNGDETVTVTQTTSTTAPTTSSTTAPAPTSGADTAPDLPEPEVPSGEIVGSADTHGVELDG